MARIISEIVEGADLFIPTSYDFFSIDTGGLPNGDDCLVVHGDLGNYLAFVRCPDIGPSNILNVNTNYQWSITCWVNIPTTDAYGVILSTANSASSGASASATSTNDPLRIQRVPTGYTSGGSLAYGNRRANNNLGNSGNWTTSGRYNTWVMCTFILNQTSPTSTPMAVYLNDEATQAGSQSAGGTVSAWGSNLYLAIGHYGRPALYYPAEFRIGKIAFHDHALDYTERLLLWHAMMGP